MRRRQEYLLTQRRKFLLFLPSGQPSLRAVLSYYSATANVNQEGDVNINDTLQGFGKLSTSHVNKSTPEYFDLDDRHTRDDHSLSS
jgi:hypothetical protein